MAQADKTSTSGANDEPKAGRGAKPLGKAKPPKDRLPRKSKLDRAPAPKGKAPKGKQAASVLKTRHETVKGQSGPKDAKSTPKSQPASGKGKNAVARLIALRPGMPSVKEVDAKVLQGGQPLPKEMADFATRIFKRRFASVILHTDGRSAMLAQAIDAQAFAVGNHIFAAPGTFDVRSSKGRKLLAHELAHVVQAEARSPDSQSKLKLGASGDKAEQEADAVGETVGRGGSAPVIRERIDGQTIHRFKQDIAGRTSSGTDEKLHEQPGSPIDISAGGRGWAKRRTSVPPQSAPNFVTRKYDTVGFTEVAYGVVTRSWGAESGPDGVYSTVVQQSDGHGTTFDVVRVWALKRRSPTVFNAAQAEQLLGGLNGPIAAAAAQTLPAPAPSGALVALANHVATQNAQGPAQANIPQLPTQGQPTPANPNAPQLPTQGQATPANPNAPQVPTQGQPPAPPAPPPKLSPLQQLLQKVEKAADKVGNDAGKGQDALSKALPKVQEKAPGLAMTLVKAGGALGKIGGAANKLEAAMPKAIAEAPKVEKAIAKAPAPVRKLFGKIFRKAVGGFMGKIATAPAPAKAPTVLKSAPVKPTSVPQAPKVNIPKPSAPASSVPKAPAPKAPAPSSAAPKPPAPSSAAKAVIPKARPTPPAPKPAPKLPKLSSTAKPTGARPQLPTSKAPAPKTAPKLPKLEPKTSSSSTAKPTSQPAPKPKLPQAKPAVQDEPRIPKKPPTKPIEPKKLPTKPIDKKPPTKPPTKPPVKPVGQKPPTKPISGKPGIQPKPQVKPASGVRPQVKPAHPAGKLPVKPAPKTGPKLPTKPAGAKPPVKPATKPFGPKAAPKPATKPLGAKPKTKPATKPLGAKPKPKPASKPLGTKPKTKPLAVKAKPKPKTKPATKPLGAKAKPKAGVTAKPRPAPAKALGRIKAKVPAATKKVAPRKLPTLDATNKPKAHPKGLLPKKPKAVAPPRPKPPSKAKPATTLDKRPAPKKKPFKPATKRKPDAKKKPAPAKLKMRPAAKKKPAAPKKPLAAKLKAKAKPKAKARPTAHPKGKIKAKAKPGRPSGKGKQAVSGFISGIAKHLPSPVFQPPSGVRPFREKFIRPRQPWALLDAPVQRTVRQRERGIKGVGEIFGDVLTRKIGSAIGSQAEVPESAPVPDYGAPLGTGMSLARSGGTSGGRGGGNMLGGILGALKAGLSAAAKLFNAVGGASLFGSDMMGFVHGGQGLANAIGGAIGAVRAGGLKEAAHSLSEVAHAGDSLKGMARGALGKIGLHLAPQAGALQLGPAYMENAAVVNERAAERMLQKQQFGDPTTDGAQSRRFDEGKFLAPQPGGGLKLRGEAKNFAEDFFGRSFGDVRIHLGTPAEKAAGGLRAHAFTTGNDIYFGRNEFRPDTPRGMALLVHELTHVVQQGGGVKRSAIAGLGAEAMGLSMVHAKLFNTKMLGQLAATVAPTVNKVVGVAGNAAAFVNKADGALHSATPVLNKLGLGKVAATVDGALHKLDAIGDKLMPVLNKIQAAVNPKPAPPPGVPGAPAPAPLPGGVDGEIPMPARPARSASGVARALPGLPIPHDIRARLEEEIEVDLARVRLFTGDDASKAAAGQGADAYAVGDSVVLGERAAAEVAKGNMGTLAHELEHVRQHQKGEHLGSKSPVARELLEETAKEVERRMPTFSKAMGVGEFLLSPKTIEKVAEGLPEELETLRKPAKPKAEVESILDNPNGGGDEEPAPDGSDLVSQLMWYYGVRPQVGEEDFLEELTERVRDIMEEELKVERERRWVEAPF